MVPDFHGQNLTGGRWTETDPVLGIFGFQEFLLSQSAEVQGALAHRLFPNFSAKVTRCSNYVVTLHASGC